MKVIPLTAIATLLVSQSPLIAIEPTDLDNLGLISPLPTGIILEDVTASGNTVVAGGLFGILVVSENGGVSWEQRDPVPGFSSFDGVYHLSNDGTNFVALGSNKVSSSSDLENWAQETIPASLTDIDHGNGVFVITASSGDRIYVTADGTNATTASNLPADVPPMRGVAFGGGVFVAGGDEGTLLRSVDGQTWTSVFSGIPGRTGSADRFDYVSYANGMFFATGADSLIYSSPDGTNWTPRTTDESGNYRNAAYVGGTYLFGNSLSGTYTTSDLVDYERRNWGNANGTQQGFAMVGSTLINVGRAGYIGSSTDGLNWTERRQRLGDQFGSVVYGEEKFVTFDESEERIFTSTSGASWTFAHQMTNAYRTGLAYGTGRFVVIGNGFVAWSEDGSTWTEEAHNLMHLPDSIHFVNGRFVVLGRSGEISESADGVDWTERGSGTSEWLYDIDFGDGLYAIANASNAILTSPDLITWTPRATGVAESEYFTDIAFDGSRFLAARTFRDFVTSADGVTWSLVADSPSYFVRELEYDPDLGFFILGTQGTVRYAGTDSDLSTWTDKRLPIALSIYGLVEGGGSVVAVGDTGLLMSTVAGNFGFSGWIMTNFPGINDPNIIGINADPDRDGASNFEEYARSTNPNTTTPPLVTAYDRTGFGPRIIWTQIAPPDGVTPSVEYSTDLSGWLSQGIIFDTDDNGDGTVTYTAQLTGTIGNEDRVYLRVRWTSQ